MTILCFSDAFSTFERRILRATAKVNCVDLGIDKADIIVDVRKLSMGPGYRALIARTGRDHFSMILSESNTLAQSIFAVGHECVHIKQHLTGQMIDTGDGVLWQGQFIHESYCQSQYFYESLPWEIEARARQKPLYDSAMNKLSHDDVVAIMGELEEAA